MTDDNVVGYYRLHSPSPLSISQPERWHSLYMCTESRGNLGTAVRVCKDVYDRGFLGTSTQTVHREIQSWDLVQCNQAFYHQTIVTACT